MMSEWLPVWGKTVGSCRFSYFLHGRLLGFLSYFLPSDAVSSYILHVSKWICFCLAGRAYVFDLCFAVRRFYLLYLTCLQEISFRLAGGALLFPRRKSNQNAA